jgi:hypothetical protein
MTTVKRINDLVPYASVLPYASEMFGVYQPLLGWKSKRIEERFRQGVQSDRRLALDTLTRQFTGVVALEYRDGNILDLRVAPGTLNGGTLRSYDSVVLDRVAANLPPWEAYAPSVWPQAITRDRLEVILKNDVVNAYMAAFAELRKSAGARGGAPDTSAFERQLAYESAVAGALLYLVQAKASAALEEVFYATRNTAERAEALARTLAREDDGLAFLDLTNLNPRDRDHLQGVVLSPIAVVHLFRQYFFELDTFLGTPESHVWLSPGSSVELFEIHTRRTLVEKTLETVVDVTTTSEKTTTEQEEISEAVKEDNSQDVKFGAGVKASYGSVEATSSFDYGASQKQARETTHKRMRQQTDKLSSEIRRSFKSTFKTTTELTDVSSTRHVMANNTEELINYELRRKMRQVGVQVQDIGTFLCWQTYVDDPGRDLGLATLIHVAKPADLDTLPHPEEIPLLQPVVEEKMITVPFISVEGTNADNEDEVYVDGYEADNSEFMGSQERIQADFEQECVAPKAGYALQSVEFDSQGKPVTVSMKGGIHPTGDRAKFTLHLESVDFQGQNSVEVKLILHWSPSQAANDAIVQKNDTGLATFREQERVAHEKAMVEAVKERVTIASKIARRRSEELREEERIIVYRRLIQEMLLQGVPLPDDRTRHVVAEVLNAIFDVEKMLYFVAPEWWRPRLHRSRQQLQQTPEPGGGPHGFQIEDKVVLKGLQKKAFSGAAAAQPSLLDASSVGWGGTGDRNRDNYYITEESDPARFGSSLGWLLQLDGDNMRNAFLNAPWVKAVIPIRPGREEAAINWLKGVEGMNGITDDVIYHASKPEETDSEGRPTEGQKMIDVLLDLAKKIKRKYEEGTQRGTYPTADEVADPSLVDAENTVTATPIDRVYEHGFFPLEGGFRANVGGNYEIFDQWIEILPTDQIVPVEVKYDPKTGRQI